MRSIRIKALLFVFFPCIVNAQLKQLTLEEAVLQQRSTLAPKRLAQLQWIKGSNDYSFVETKDKVETLMRGNATTNGTKVIVSFADLNKAIKLVSTDTLSRMLPITWENSSQFTIAAGNNLVLFDTKSGKTVIKDTSSLPSDVSLIEEGGKYTSYVSKYNLYVENNHKSTQITFDGSKDIVYGKSVHREEFGIEKGQFWSPNNNLLAFYRMDQSMVTNYPIVDFNERPAVDNEIKYPFSGGKSHEVTVGIYEVSSNKTIHLKTGEPKEQYLTNIAWSPDEKFVYIAVVNRDQNFMKLNKYSASTGDFIATLFEEKDEKYTEPLHPMEFVPGQPNQFIWQSRKDGFNHLYLYNENGTIVRQLTKGPWEVIDVTSIDAKSKSIYFTSTINGAINRDFCSVDLASGKVKRITTGDGVHTITYNANGQYFIDNFSSLNTPRIISIKSTSGKETQVLLNADNPLKDYSIGATSLFTIKSKLGDDLYCRMITPVNFDSTKKYPVIVYLYGGPHVQLVTNTWLGGGDLWYQYMAERGFIVFTLDNHGSGNRGKAFEQATFRNLGTVEMQDQLSGVDYLKSLSYVDGSRIGVNGWSFGGFMTTSLMTRNPGIYKVGVAGGPVIDWSAYEIMYTERYMDSPAQNPDGYKASNLLNYVDQLKGKLLMIHGTSDDVVVWQNSLMYVKKAVSKNNLFLDYYVYPGHLHNVSGKDRVHLMGKISQYFIENL
jgi:dipeptidyl-peptidase-4